MEIGKDVEIQRKNPETGEWESIGNLISCDVDPIVEDWQECLKGKKEWSITIDCTFIDWDATWLVAYQARMYANHFKN